MLAALSFPFSKKERKGEKEETGTQRVEMPELRNVLRTRILHNARKNAYVRCIRIPYGGAGREERSRVRGDLHPSRNGKTLPVPM